jgi:hypothetical protein
MWAGSHSAIGQITKLMDMESVQPRGQASDLGSDSAWGIWAFLCKGNKAADFEFPSSLIIQTANPDIFF